MELFECNSELYKANCDPTARVYVNQGGTSSGKTYCIMQRLIAIALTEPYSIITVVGQDLPNLKVGAMRDLKTMLQKSQFLADQFSENRSDLTFTSPNGSIIEFKSYDDEQDAKSGKRDYLFVNEANGITYGIYWQLQMRTRKKVWLDYNPSSRFWVHDKVIGGDGVRLIISDHRANRFLTEAEHKRIENTDDRELWLVYARGLTGKLTGLVNSTIHK
jgi:phage terminase large subunit